MGDENSLCFKILICEHHTSESCPKGTIQLINEISVPLEENDDNAHFHNFCIPVDPSLLEAFFEDGSYFLPLLLTGRDGLRLHGASLIFAEHNGLFKSYGILSEYPMYELYYHVLTDLLSVTRDPAIDTSKYMEGLFHRLCATCQERRSSTLALHTKSLEFQISPVAEMSTVDMPISHLFEQLNFCEILDILTGILLERRIVIISRDISVLTPMLRSLCSLIKPFEWKHVLIPVLPEMEAYSAFMSAPLPFIMGASSLPLYTLGPDVLVFNYDERVRSGFDSLPPLPRNLVDHLRRWLKMLVPQLVDHATHVLSAQPLTALTSAQVRLTFFHFMVEILFRCQEHLERSEFHISLSKKVVTAWGEECHFVAELTATQLFQTYCIEADKPTTHGVVKEFLGIVRDNNGLIPSVKSFFCKSRMLDETLIVLEKRYVSLFLEKSTVTSVELNQLSDHHEYEQKAPR